MFFEEHVAIAEIARRLEIDRKTVRRCLRGLRGQLRYKQEAIDTVLLDPAVVGEGADRGEEFADVVAAPYDLAHAVVS